MKISNKVISQKVTVYNLKRSAVVGTRCAECSIDGIDRTFIVHRPILIVGRKTVRLRNGWMLSDKETGKMVVQHGRIGLNYDKATDYLLRIEKDKIVPVNIGSILDRA